MKIHLPVIDIRALALRPGSTSLDPGAKSYSIMYAITAPPSVGIPHRIRFGNSSRFIQVGACHLSAALPWFRSRRFSNGRHDPFARWQMFYRALVTTCVHEWMRVSPISDDGKVSKAVAQKKKITSVINIFFFSYGAHFHQVQTARLMCFMITVMGGGQ